MSHNNFNSSSADFFEIDAKPRYIVISKIVEKVLDVIRPADKVGFKKLPDN